MFCDLGLKSLGIKESSPNPVASTAQSNSTSTTSGQDNKVIIRYVIHVCLLLLVIY